MRRFAPAADDERDLGRRVRYLLANGGTVRVLDLASPPRLDTIHRMLRGGDALVVRHGAAHWPAMRRYSFEYFAERCRDAPVYVRGGRYAYRVFGLAPLAEFLASVTGRSRWLGGTEALDAVVRAHPSRGPVHLYAVYGQLLARHPELAQDVRFDELLPDCSRMESPSWWFGPAECETPFHTDLNSNVFVQVVGSKRFDLLPNTPSVVARLEPVDCYEPGTDYSGIDFAADARAPQRFPEWVTIEVHPGDVVYLPSRMWHQVTSLTASISVQVFFDDWLDVGQTAERWKAEVRRWLHLAGVHSVGRCTCHGTQDVIAHMTAGLPVHLALAARIGRLKAHGRSLDEIAGW